MKLNPLLIWCRLSLIVINNITRSLSCLSRYIFSINYVYVSITFSSRSHLLLLKNKRAKLLKIIVMDKTVITVKFFDWNIDYHVQLGTWAFQITYLYFKRWILFRFHAWLCLNEGVISSDFETGVVVVWYKCIVEIKLAYSNWPGKQPVTIVGGVTRILWNESFVDGF